jgi:hypothetical protein
MYDAVSVKVRLRRTNCTGELPAGYELQSEIKFSENFTLPPYKPLATTL